MSSEVVAKCLSDTQRTIINASAKVAYVNLLVWEQFLGPFCQLGKRHNYNVCKGEAKDQITNNHQVETIWKEPDWSNEEESHGVDETTHDNVNFLINFLWIKLDNHGRNELANDDQAEEETYFTLIEVKHLAQVNRDDRLQLGECRVVEESKNQRHQSVPVVEQFKHTQLHFAISEAIVIFLVNRRLSILGVETRLNLHWRPIHSGRHQEGNHDRAQEEQGRKHQERQRETTVVVEVSADDWANYYS